MCLLALMHRVVPEAPLLVAANREEFFDRPFLPPHVQGEGPRFVAGLDVRAGGTWLGVNEHALFVAVTNRPLERVPAKPRSRGLLCRDLLTERTAAAAAARAVEELADGEYAGANFVVADAQAAFLIERADVVRQQRLAPGLHLLTNGTLDDPHDPRQSLARELFAEAPLRTADEFMTAARRVCSFGPQGDSGRTIIVRTPQRGTVSSTLVALPDDPDRAAYLFTSGAPDATPYTDHSGLLRELWGRPAPQVAAASRS